jgi:hypothetical protein
LALARPNNCDKCRQLYSNGHNGPNTHQTDIKCDHLISNSVNSDKSSACMMTSNGRLVHSDAVYHDDDVDGEGGGPIKTLGYRRLSGDDAV